MFSSLQDALKKLRENKQTEEHQPKRPALQQPVPPPQPPTHDEDLSVLDDIDMADVELFDDLVAEDTAAQDSARQPPIVCTPAPAYRTPLNSQPPGTRPLAPSQTASSQSDQCVTPRTSSRASNHAKTITTTVVSRRRNQNPLWATAQRQEIPGPAGRLDGPVAAASGGGSGIGPTQQKPASPFKTLLSRHLATTEQSGTMDFEGGTWAAMLDHLGMPAYTPATAKTVVRTVAAAEWPVRRVLESVRTQRIPTMLVQLRDMGGTDTDTSVIVADPTGEIQASIHKPVIKRFIHFLVAGTSIILKDVVALKLPLTPPLLVITATSIDQIFTSKGPGTREDPIVLSSTQMPESTLTRAPPNRASSPESVLDNQQTTGSSPEHVIVTSQSSQQPVDDNSKSPPVISAAEPDLLDDNDLLGDDDLLDGDGFLDLLE